jgi:broad specificity phosphatase PhoE
LNPAKATRLRLVCHGATSATRAAAFPNDDEPLEKQAIQCTVPFPGLGRADRSWTSPALRATATAEALQLGAAIEPMLRDWDHGSWTGRTLADIQAEHSEAVAQWLRDPAAAPHGGETLLDLFARVSAWLEAQSGAPGRVVAVTHASVIRAAIVHAIGAPPPSFWRIDIAPLSVTALSFSHGNWKLGSIVPAKAATR